MHSLASAQSVGINSTGATPASSAMLDVESTTKGILIPRMTKVERNGISSLANGLMIYQIDETPGFYYYNGTAWIGVATSVNVDSLRSRITVLESQPGLVMDVDGNAYKTVRIGNQVWMAENLRVTHYRNGDSIPNIPSSSEWTSQSAGACCDYGNSPANIITYGKLYNWYSVDDARGLAPAGWHVPTDADWITLSLSLGGDDVSGGKMKEPGLIHWLSSNIDATNSSGLTSLPGGIRNALGDFSLMGSYCYWWTSTQRDAIAAWNRHIGNGLGSIFRSSYSKATGYSVRCVKD